MNRKDFQALADVRIAEAEALSRGGFFDGAYYLAGYAVECALKACIAKMTRRFDFPDKNAGRYYTHDLTTLIHQAKLLNDWNKAVGLDKLLKANWLTVQSWSEESRYTRKSKRDAEELIGAITDTSHGVLPWLKARW